LNSFLLLLFTRRKGIDCGRPGHGSFSLFPKTPGPFFSSSLSEQGLPIGPGVICFCGYRLFFVIDPVEILLPCIRPFTVGPVTSPCSPVLAAAFSPFFSLEPRKSFSLTAPQQRVSPPRPPFSPPDPTRELLVVLP